MSDSKNDIAWKRLFDTYNIVDRVRDFGHAFINAGEINVYREARLMTKFDHKSQLPKLFKDNSLCILPVSRGGYVIGDFQAYHHFNEVEVDIERIPSPSFLESLNFRDITSESTAINCAFVSKILNYFTEEEELFPTVNGRMSSSQFSFAVNHTRGLFNINVNNSQVEIDGGYEGTNSLNLIEAKNYISDDFLVRQLYYPYKLWSNKINKPVRSIFLTYTNGIFHLREYAFEDIGHYNSLRLVKEKKYTIQDGVLNMQMVQEILDKVPLVNESRSIPFPQADSFERVINLCELLKEKGSLTKEEITINYDFAGRQTDYYTNALKYLGLLQLTSGSVSLTEAGANIFNLTIYDRQAEFIKLILAHAPFKETLKRYLREGNIPTANDIVEIMRNSDVNGVSSDSTYLRRASTIIGWVNWIVSSATNDE